MSLQWLPESYRTDYQKLSVLVQKYLTDLLLWDRFTLSLRNRTKQDEAAFSFYICRLFQNISIYRSRI